MNTSIKTAFSTCLVGLAIMTLTGIWSQAQAQTPATTEPEVGQLMMSELLRTHLQGVDGTEVIVSRVVLPPNTALPRHWHPGEEFAYVIDGSVVLLLEDEDEMVLTEGQIGEVPLKKVHSAKSQDAGATVLVFRVHESGEPERHIVE